MSVWSVIKLKYYCFGSIIDQVGHISYQLFDRIQSECDIRITVISKLNQNAKMGTILALIVFFITIHDIYPYPVNDLDNDVTNADVRQKFKLFSLLLSSLCWVKIIQWISLKSWGRFENNLEGSCILSNLSISAVQTCSL